MDIDLGTVLGSKVATSVGINGIFVPANSVSRYLQTYSEPALFHNPDFPDFELTRRGTLLKGCYRGHYFGLVTAHQASDFEYEQLVIHEKSRASASSSGSCTFSNAVHQDESKFDCRLYDFTKPVESGALPRTSWLVFKDTWFSLRPEDATFAIAIGYPTDLNEIDHENRRFVTQAFAADAVPTDSAISDRKAIEFSRPLKVDADGLSGSPVYGFFVDASGVQFALLGVVTNAGRAIAHYLPIEVIRRYLKRAFFG